MQSFEHFEMPIFTCLGVEFIDSQAGVFGYSAKRRKPTRKSMRTDREVFGQLTRTPEGLPGQTVVPEVGVVLDGAIIEIDGFDRRRVSVRVTGRSTEHLPEGMDQIVGWLRMERVI